MKWVEEIKSKLVVVFALSVLAIPVCSYAGSVAVDPTAPLGWQKPVSKARQVRQPLPALQSIICTVSCDAVIGGKSVAAGDVVDGYRVGKISDSSVLLYRDGKQWQLSLFRDQVKQY
ncbi:MSHA biogenesis protein MshK [Parasalinivibrio latis]|uniref:MSHA biogenesis protein MshK n=1 Tax=Parasalinivibrio latis TaxID=2952610 RepID=UPI003DA28153